MIRTEIPRRRLATWLLFLFLLSLAGAACRRFDPPQAEKSAARSAYALGLGLSSGQAAKSGMRRLETVFTQKARQHAAAENQKDPKNLVLPQLQERIEGTLHYPLLDAAGYRPFFPRDSYELSLNQILFRSLFRYDIEGNLQPDLVDHISFSQDQRVVEISLSDKAYFENRQAVSPADVKACIDYLSEQNRRDGRENACVQDYAHDLASIERCEVIDSYGLRIFLNKADPFIAHALVFPLLSAEDVTKRGLREFKASADYIQSKEAGKAYAAFEKREANAEETARIRRIEFYSYPNAGALRAAFAAEDVDLYFAYPGEAAFLRRPHFVFGSNEGIILRNSERNLRNQQDLQVLREAFSDLYRDFKIFRPVDPALLPQGYPLVQKLIPGNLYPESANYRVRRKPGTALQQLTQSELSLIYSENLLFSEELAEALKALAEHQGCRLKLEKLSEREFRARLAAGSYDLCLDSQSYLLFPDPAYYFEEERNGDFWRAAPAADPADKKNYVDPEQRKNSLEFWRNYKLRENQFSPLLDTAVTEKFLQFCRNLNFMPLASYSRALYLTDRMEGNLQCNAMNPLEGFENLWINGN